MASFYGFRRRQRARSFPAVNVRITVATSASPIAETTDSSTMSTTRETPNPLRPYYVPPSVGLSPDSLPSYNQSGGADTHSRGFAATRARPTLSSSARDILSDLDYSDYLSDGSSSAASLGKRLLDQALWKYTSVLLAQPFEVAKTILQCHLVEPLGGSSERCDMRRVRGHDRDDIYMNVRLAVLDPSPTALLTVLPGHCGGGGRRRL